MSDSEARVMALALRANHTHWPNDRRVCICGAEWPCNQRRAADVFLATLDAITQHAEAIHELIPRWVYTEVNEHAGAIVALANDTPKEASDVA